MAARGFSDKPTPYRVSTSATSKAMAGFGRTPPGPDAASLRRIAEGSVGRDLAPTTGRKTGLPASLTPEAVERKKGEA